MFQGIMEKGHYGGRFQPTDTRQGTYALSPSGIFLASCNTNDPAQMAKMLQRALDTWNTMPKGDRLRASLPQPQLQRAETKRPSDGLILRVFSRDLPRGDGVACATDWRKDAWNQDYAWFNKVEVSTFIPVERRVGASVTIPQKLAARLARAHFVDNVRGQTPSFPPEAIKVAEITSVVEKVAGDTIRLRLTGHTVADETGRWAVEGFRDMEKPTDQKRTIETKLLGHAIYDAKAERFTEFELVAVGTRAGATQYNGRGDDPGPAPIGYYLTLAKENPAQQVAPANVWAYEWLTGR